MSRRLPLVLLLTVIICGAAHGADKPRIGATEAWVLPPLAAGAAPPGVADAALAVLTQDAQLRFDGKGVTRFPNSKSSCRPPRG